MPDTYSASPVSKVDYLWLEVRVRVRVRVRIRIRVRVRLEERLTKVLLCVGRAIRVERKNERTTLKKGMQHKQITKTKQDNTTQ